MNEETLLQKIKALACENEVLKLKLEYLELRSVPFQTRTYIQQLEEKNLLLSKQIEVLKQASLRSSQATAKG